MKREWDLNEVSDGKRYGVNDLVKLNANHCEGCSACCHDMGSSIVLDPLDVHHLVQSQRRSFDELLGDCLELQMVDRMILPNLKMNTKNNACFFLNEEGRCLIHPYRPGICRMFPLGRIYEERSFSYFLQVNECQKNRSKVRISKWLETPDLKQNQQFIAQWHYLLKDVVEAVEEAGLQEQFRQINLYMLNQFYRKPYEEEFYTQISERMRQAREDLGIEESVEEKVK